MNAVRVARSPEPGTDKYVPVWSATELPAGQAGLQPGLPIPGT